MSQLVSEVSNGDLSVFAVSQDVESPDAYLRINAASPEAAASGGLGMCPEPFGLHVWRGCMCLAADIPASVAAVLPTAGSLEIGHGLEGGSAGRTRHEDSSGFGEAVVFLDMAVRAEQAKSFWEIPNFLQVHTTGLIGSLCNVMELQRAQASVVTTLLATASKRVYEPLLDALNVLPIHCPYLRMNNSPIGEL